MTIARPFQRLLIANRGEIACRIIRTAKRMGMTTIAVYSEADRKAQHVKQADYAAFIGAAEARESYLNIQAILTAAKMAGAEAIHPGYGFLSENADFADACTAEGFIFVGPTGEAMRAMGDKAHAKQLMQKAGVPLLPGYDGDDQSDATLQGAAVNIGFPLLIKPSAGGGGKGMKIVERAEDLLTLLPIAKREAKAAFGDDRVILEKFLSRPRHVEVQVFGDTLSNVVHLFERDCSPQRRYQKVVEEAPAQNLPPETLARIHDTAIAAAKAVHYTGAGTVEFLIDATTLQPYFMEMNTRLQVEHPVTEAITGLDLVEWQLRVAMGERLPKLQAAITSTGHSIEVRLYAEDASNGFLPQTGTLEHLHFPAPDHRTRIDSGIVAGDTISIYYDPMVAKLIATAATRHGAIAQLKAMLEATEVVGLTTNRSFLHHLISHPEFAAGSLDTGWLDRTLPDLIDVPPPPYDLAKTAAVLWLKAQQKNSTDPWKQANNWQLNLAPTLPLTLALGEATETIAVSAADLASQPTARHVVSGNNVHLFVGAEHYTYVRQDPLANTSGSEAADHHLRAPMPGRILAVPAVVGQKVAKGTPLVVLEAMKMEHTLRAPSDGMATALRCAVGDQVTEGFDLVEWEKAE